MLLMNSLVLFIQCRKSFGWVWLSILLVLQMMKCGVVLFSLGLIFRWLRVSNIRIDSSRENRCSGQRLDSCLVQKLWVFLCNWLLCVQIWVRRKLESMKKVLVVKNFRLVSLLRLGNFCFFGQVCRVWYIIMYRLSRKCNYFSLMKCFLELGVVMYFFFVIVMGGLGQICKFFGKFYWVGQWL